MASGKRPISSAFKEEEEEEEDEEGQLQNRKRQRLQSSDDDSEEEKEASPDETTTNPPDIPVKVKAKMPDVPLADKYRGGKFFFVRECYAKYYSKVEALLVKDNEECVTVTGTPGIGKSIFYAFFFDRFSKTHPDWTIIVSTYKKNHEIKKLVVFEPTKSTRYDNPKEAEEALVTARKYGHDKVLWLCDGPPKIEHGQTVVFTSPNEWLRLAKNDKQTYYMPPWTLKELQLAASVLEYPLTGDEIDSRFWKFGGVPRNCFELDSVGVTIAIRDLTEPIEKITNSERLENLLIGKRNSDTHHRFLLYNPEEDGRLYNTAIVSDMVCEKLVEQLFYISKRKKAKVHELLEGIRPAASLRGWIFENDAHSKLREMKQLRTRSLVQPNKKEVFKMQKSYEIDVFQGNTISPALLNNGPYHKPNEKNFASIDGFFFPKLPVGTALTMDAKDNRILLFQMTVSNDHPVRASGIINLLKKLGLLNLVKANPEYAALVFVCPTDRSKDFPQQRILSDDTPSTEIRDLKGVGQETVNVLAKYKVKSIAQLEAKVDDFEDGSIKLDEKEHKRFWKRAVRCWRNEEQCLKEPSNIKMVKAIPQYVYP